MPKRFEDLKPEPPEMILLNFEHDISDEGIDNTNLLILSLFGAECDIDWRDPRTVEITNFITRVSIGRKYH